MSTFFHILKYKLLSFVKSTFEWKWVSIVRGFGSLFVFGGFAFGAYLFSHTTTMFLLDNVRLGLYVFHRFLSVLLFAFFVVVNLGNIVVSYSTLYRSAEVNFLLTKPVSYTHIFVLKFLDNFLYSSTTLFLVAFTALLGYGSYFGHPWYFFVAVMFLVLIPFMFLAACLAVMILMAVLKLASRIGFRQVMAVLAVLYFGSIVAFFRYSNPVRFIEFVNRADPSWSESLRFVEPHFLSYLPSQWVTNVLYFAARGDVSQSMLYGSLLLYITAIAFLLVLVIGYKFYYRSWLVSLQIQSRGNEVVDVNKRNLLDFRNESMWPSQMESLLKKEYFSFFREPSQWIHLVMMIVLTFIFVVSVGSLNLRVRVTTIQLITYLMFFAFSGFLSSSLALRFVFPMASLEGQAQWIVRSSPVEQRKVFLTKFFIGFVLVLALAEIVAVAMNIPFMRFGGRRPLPLYFGIYSAFFMSLGMTAVNLGFGGYFANYQEKNPIRLASTQGATLTFLFTLVYLIAMVTVVLQPISRYFEMLFAFRRFEMPAIVAPGTAFAVLSMLLAVFAIHIGLRSLRRDF